MANLKLVKSATALVLGASVLTSAVAVSGTDASAKTTYKVTKAGTLVNAKTNKAVKGYKSYKGKLYKNGKKLTGTYKSVFYKSGVKFTGTYNKKYYVKGKLFTGKTSKNVYYKKGVKFTGVTSYGYTYKDGKRVEGEYKGKVYKNGKLLTGLYKDVLYKKGVKVTGLDLYKDKLYNEGVLNVGLALFQEKLYKDADLANGLVTYNGVEDLYKDGVIVPTKVEAVKAVNEKTLQLSGSALKKITAENISLAGNEVTSVTADADGNTSTVTFKYNLTLDQEQTLKVVENGSTKEFKFTFKLDEIKTVELETKTYDDDTKGQLLTFKVNGNAISSDSDFLRQAGYTVNFVAVDKNNSAASIFKTGTNSSTTGLLADKNQPGNYTVEVQLVKAGKVVLSDKKVITITDLESSVTSIDTVNLLNYGANKTTGSSETDDFVQKSNSLVAGEKVQVTKLVGKANGKTDTVLPLASATVTSSNASVLSVNGTVLTANGPGTAEVTIKIGNVTKIISITVTNKERVLTKVTPSESTINLIKSQARTVKVTAVDQYGDPIAVATGDATGASAVVGAVDEDYPKNAAGTNLVAPSELVTTAVKGEGTYTITANEVGTGVILFKDKNGKTVGQISTNITEVDNVAAHKVEFTPTSAVTSNSFEVGDVATYQYSKFNNAGAFNGVETLIASAPVAATPGYYVESANPQVAIVAVSGNAFTVTGVKAGTTDITIKNAAGQILDKFTVTIAQESIAITKVNFKATTSIDYVGKKVDIADVLDVRADGTNDSIVYGIEHNANTVAKVRLSSTSGTNNLVIYIDNGTTAGLLDNDDTVLGYVQAEVLSGSTTAVANTPIAAITDILVGGSNYTTASKDKGQILFRVLEDDTKLTSTIASTTLNVDVK